METNVKLYTLNFDEVKTYIWAAAFVVCNMVLPQLFHLIPQGGIIFAPLSLVILAGAYKLAWGVLQVMMLKLVVLALVAGLAAKYFRSVSLLMIIGVVLASEAFGGLGELLLTGGVSATVQDFTLGWPGLLLQILGTYLIVKYVTSN